LCSSFSRNSCCRRRQQQLLPSLPLLFFFPRWTLARPGDVSAFNNSRSRSLVSLDCWTRPGDASAARPWSFRVERQNPKASDYGFLPSARSLARPAGWSLLFRWPWCPFRWREGHAYPANCGERSVRYVLPLLILISCSYYYWFPRMESGIQDHKSCTTMATEEEA
jgi:hypothetical protein